MDKKRHLNTRMIATTGMLLALEIVLQIIGNYVVIPGGFANLNFSLIFIALGAILYGPIIGSLILMISSTPVPLLWKMKNLNHLTEI